MYGELLIQVNKCDSLQQWLEGIDWLGNNSFWQTKAMYHILRISSVLQKKLKKINQGFIMWLKH